MRGKSTIAVTIVSVILLTSMIPLPIAEGHGTVDQTFTGPFTTTLRLDLVQPDTGQSFTPTADTLTAVDIFLTDSRTTPTITIKIRQGNINGPLIGQVTQTVNVAGGSIGSPRTGHFDFSPPLVLTPNTLYVIEGITSNPVGWAGNNQLSLYPGGTAIQSGFAAGSFDFGFRTFFGELNPPTVSITSPSNNEIISTSPFTITGTASDDTNVAKVEVSIDGGPFQLATGTNPWTFEVSSLFDGSHTVIAIATDDFDNTGQSPLVDFTTVTIGLGIEGLINQLINQLTGIANDINSILTDTALILGILQDPNIGLQEIKNELQALEAKLDDPNIGLQEIKNELQSIETKIDALDLSILQDIQTEVTNIELKLDDPNIGLQEIKNELQALELKLDDPATGLAEIKAEVADIQTTVNALDLTPLGGIATLQASLDDPATGLAEIKNELQALELKLDDPATGLAEIKKELQSIEIKIDALDVGILQDILTEVSTIEEVVTAPTVASFIDTETIDLDGHLSAGDFKLLMDITPFQSVTGHVAMKVPCDKQGNTDLAILTGVAPAVTPLTMNFVAALSDPGKSCLYHGDVGAGITDVALINTGEKPVNFGPNEEGFSVTITIQGTE